MQPRWMQNWAEKLHSDGEFGEIEQLLHQIGTSEYHAQVLGGIPMSQGEIVRLSDIGISDCLLYTSPSPRDRTRSRMPSSA